MSQLLPLASIRWPSGRRRVDPDWVETLGDLFSVQGQLVPIEVIADGDTYVGVFGRHRFEAARSIGWAEIKAEIVDPSSITDRAELTLREIAENFVRRDLSVLDRAVDIVRWREAYNAAHTVSKGGRSKKSAVPEELTAKFAASFSVAAQKVFGLSERSIFLAVKVASIDEAVRQRIALHPVADNQTELLLLAEQSADRQTAIAAMLTAEPATVGTVTAGIALIDKTPIPTPLAGWQKVATSFASLKEVDQHRFFDLHHAAIERWLKDRSAT